MSVSFEDLVKQMQAEHPTRKHPSSEEHDIQCACVKWFRYQYPKLRARLFSVPNGGKRDRTTAGKLKAEGALPGVSDLILLKSNAQYGALLIEMKTEKGRQSPEQKEWQKAVCSDKEYKYTVCHSFDEFKKEIEDYLK